jgi:hypothetical protein
MEQKTTIHCPNCGFDLDVNDIIYHQLEEELKMKFNSQLNDERKKFEEQAENIKQQREKLEKDKKDVKEQINARVSQLLKSEKEQMEQTIRKKMEEEDAYKYEALQKELNEKSEKLKEYNQAKAEIEKLKREKNEMKDEIEVEAMKRLNETLLQETDRIRKAEQDKNELVMRELQKKLDDQKRLTEEMQRKQEQGSMQLQGEVQELAIEEWLKNSFPLDNIQEIKKGVNGADCIQVVNSYAKNNCGRIYYESKRAKVFAGDWISKFKADMRAQGIAIGILVSQVYPKGLDRMGIVDGIYICSYEEFKGLSTIIREYVIKIDEAVASQDNKGDKMVMLYDYLISPAFRAQIEAIVEGFAQMGVDLNREKKAMNALWSAREKQIEKVLTNTTGMYGSIKGIAGNAIAAIKSLELGAGTDQEEGLN